MKTEYFEVMLYVTGIKKKERKLKRHGIKLSNVLYNEIHIDEEAIKLEAKVKAAEVMKSITAHVKTITMVYSYELSEVPDMIISNPFSELSRNFEVEF